MAPAMTDPFARHIAACHNLPSFAGYVPLWVAGEAASVGWLTPDFAQALASFPRDIRVGPEGVMLDPRLETPEARSAVLGEIAAALAARGAFRLRGEPFGMRATPDGPPLATLDRGAIPAFGAISQGVHVNGLVRRPDGLHLWVGWRSRDKAVAPGQLDHLIAGGIPAGMTPEETLEKEAGEEASVPPELARRARRVGRVSYVMRNAEGIRRDVLHCFDLDLPEGFVPHPNDDEVERFELWPVERVVAAVRDTDAVKFNVNLVLIDLFLREGLIDPESEQGRRLRAGLDQGPR
jgi:8-oxo-dGTP pyrophosphatase MutT (NUDIX family)